MNNLSPTKIMFRNVNVQYNSMVMLIPGFRIYILMAIAITMFLDKWLNLHPGSKIVGEISVAS
jgi:hypothetical protein